MSKWKVPLVLAVAAAAILVLLFAGATGNDVYMTTLDEWDASRARRESVRVNGFVLDGSISNEPEALVTAFVMRNEAGDTTIPVSFKGVTPGLFRDGTNVIATGRLDEGGVFRATDLMTKCPSKYEGLETPHPEGGTMPAASASGAGVSAPDFLRMAATDSRQEAPAPVGGSAAPAGAVGAAERTEAAEAVPEAARASPPSASAAPEEVAAAVPEATAAVIVTSPLGR